MIKLIKVTKNYGDVKALDEVDFEVRRGEVLGFLGPNGAGKSTAMKIITGFMAPSSGDVEVDGDLISDNSFDIRKKIGYLPETNPLYEDMRVCEYLSFIAKTRRIPKQREKSAIEKMVSSCALEEVFGKFIGELSKGYRQRVGLAQAMIHDPEILILDEPTSGLDPNQIVEIRDLIKKIGKEKTIILSTHILPEVSATCSRVVIINQGKIVAQGTSEELSAKLGSSEIVYVKFKGDSKEIKKGLESLGDLKNIKEYSGAEPYAAAFSASAENRDGREMIFEAAVKNKWIILELYKRRDNLEDVFRRLTLNE